MEHVVDRLWVLRREPEGPLASYLDAFASFLDEQGFKRHLLGRQIRVAANFSKWLLSEDIASADANDAHIQLFLRGPTRRRTVRCGEFAILRRLLGFLNQLGITRPLPGRDSATPVQRAVAAFAVYLREERALCDKTLIQYCPFVERLLSGRFGHGPVEFTALRSADIIAFVKTEAARLSPARAKAATTALRSYLRYLRFSGEIQCDLVTAVPTVPNWSMIGIPRAIAAEHLDAVFAHCLRDTSVGRRDYAILMLLARLGLRSSEIVSLTLESVDWDAGSIAVTGKGGDAAFLPMPAEVGEAIADYLRNGRPISNSRALFLRACAPIRPLGAGPTVGSIVGAAIKRAGISIRHRGTHQFRHALATDMLRHGATLTEIGSVLRHRLAKTTNIYAKVDFAALRQLGLPWPGGVE